MFIIILELSGNAIKMNLTLPTAEFSLNTVIVDWLGFKFSKDKKQEVLTGGSTILRQGKSNIDNNLNLTKVDVIDPTNDDFAEPLIVKEVLDD